MSFSLKQQKAQALGLPTNQVDMLDLAVTDQQQRENFQSPGFGFFETGEMVGVSGLQTTKIDKKEESFIQLTKTPKKQTTFVDLNVHDENQNEISKIDEVQTMKSMDFSNSHFVISDESEINQYYKN